MRDVSMDLAGGSKICLISFRCGLIELANKNCFDIGAESLVKTEPYAANASKKINRAVGHAHLRPISFPLKQSSKSNKLVYFFSYV